MTGFNIWDNKAAAVCNYADELVMHEYLLHMPVKYTAVDLEAALDVSRPTLRARFKRYGLDWKNYFISTLGDLMCEECKRIVPRTSPSQKWCKSCGRELRQSRDRKTKRKKYHGLEDKPAEPTPKSKSKWNEDKYLVNMGSRNFMPSRGFGHEPGKD